METIKLSLKNYIYAGYPGIVYNTSEEERAIEECYKVAKQARMKLFVWSLTKGIYQIVEKKIKKETILSEETIDENVSPDEDALKRGLTLNEGENVIFCVLDFHPFIKSPSVWRTAKDVFQKAKGLSISYVFISNSFEVPKELEHELIVINMDLPTKDELKHLSLDLCANFNIKLSDEEIENASDAALGLTTFEAENVFSISLAKNRNFDLGIINDVKRQIICKDGLLEYQQSSESLETIGGMHEFISYSTERFSAYSQEAQDYGLPYPKGILLVGIPGCGKSLAAKALANAWKKPLLKLDIGRLFASYVGDTEANTRRALQIAESMAPAILWLDEIDKGLSGVSSSGRGDSGVASRMFGTILTWLQEKKKPVYVIATANNISSLPQELLRKGRFDEIFFVDLPNEQERKEIFSIQIKKYKRDSNEFDIEKLVKKSEGYNGAEIEECIIASMFKAWNDGKRPYTTEDIENAILELKPASQGIMLETVKALREWSSSHGIRNANSKVTSSYEEKKSARRTIKYDD